MIGLIVVGATLVGGLALPAAAQLRTTKPPKGPRAIAVIRWQPNAQGKAVPRLLPVAILQDGKYYDASLYRASPRPMALDPGVVYEAQDKGDLLGYFTVKNASRNPTTKQWVGLGEWQASSRSKTELELRERPQTAEVVKDGKAATSPIFTEPVDDRDIKKKTTVYDEEGREIPAGQEPADEKPPTLKRQQGDIDRNPRVAPPEKKKESPTVTSADDDAERPRLKRGGQTETAGAKEPAAGETKTTGSAPAAAPAKSPDEDPNRPILRRGGSGQQKTGTSESEQTTGTVVPGRVQARGDVVATEKSAIGFAKRTFEAVAVSDAAEAPFREDFRFRWTTDEERADATARMRRLVQQEVDKFMQASGPKTVGTPSKAGRRNTPRGQVATALELTDIQMAGLDLDANNSAELVFTGRGSLDGGKTLFVTLVARTDVDGNPRKLFSVVTLSDRLDVAPRLELVDAVDADGDRRGELLFRRIRDRGAEFVIYRVGADALTELFHGGNAE